MGQKIAVVIGVGAESGIGGAMCLRAAAAGHHVVVSGRTQAKLDNVVSAIKAAGGSASACVADVTEEAAVEALFAYTDTLEGELDLVVYNAGNAHRAETLSMTAEYFEQAWKVCCLGGMISGREAAKRLVERGAGSIIFTGATASVKARPPFLPFASAKHGLRAVAQGMAREFGPKGIHVAHAIIDGGINGEILTSRAPDRVAALGENGLLSPTAIAESYWQLHVQHPSAWTFEIDLRPFKETF